MIRWVQQSTDVQAKKEVTIQQATNVVLADEEWEEQQFLQRCNQLQVCHNVAPSNKSCNGGVCLIQKQMQQWLQGIQPL
jgi:hypothetical protein